MQDKLTGLSAVLRYTTTLGRGGTQDDLRLEVSAWPNGVYLISVTDEDGYRYSERLVVRH